VRWIHVLGSIQQQYEAIAFHNNWITREKAMHLLAVLQS
jgi:hypothetical protein